MADDVVYIKGHVRTAEDLTGIPGVVYFEVEQGTGNDKAYYPYNRKLNTLSGKELKLISIDHEFYDYRIDKTGLLIKDEWILEFPNIPTEVYWDKVAIDTKIEVSDDNVTWQKYHFAQYDPNSPDGKYFFVWAEGRTSYTAINAKEIIEIQFPIWNGLGGKYFLLYSTTTKYYVWFNLDGNSTDPALIDHTGIEVEIITGDSGEAIAQKAKTAIDAEADFLVGAINPEEPDKIYIRVEQEGKTYDADPGTSNVVINVTTQGGDMINFKYARLI